MGGAQDLRYVVEGLGGRSSGGRKLEDIMLILFTQLDNMMEPSGWVPDKALHQKLSCILLTRQ